MTLSAAKSTASRAVSQGGCDLPPPGMAVSVLPYGDLVTVTLTIPRAELPALVERLPVVGEALERITGTVVPLDFPRRRPDPEEAEARREARDRARRRRDLEKAAKARRVEWIEQGRAVDQALAEARAKGLPAAEAWRAAADAVGLVGSHAKTLHSLFVRHRRQERRDLVWKLYRRGKSNAAIAACLGLSSRTIESMLAALRRERGGRRHDR